MQFSFFNNDGNILPQQGDVKLFAHLFSAEESDDYFEKLLQQISWKQEPIKIFGKEVMQPRLTAWYGDKGKAYSYSGINMQPLEWTPALLAVKQRVEEVAGVYFNSALLNLYRDGKDSMGWHRDNEKELGIDPVIASVSFGGTRTFKLRHYDTKKNTVSVELTHGSLLLMQGQTQHYWEHSIPKTANAVAQRINITFRIIR
ncbi:MAG: alpha-ketoglutarate-dependent dioxygenase AlkB [Chitinophagaceae bacterium]